MRAAPGSATEQLPSIASLLNWSGSISTVSEASPFIVESSVGSVDSAVYSSSVSPSTALAGSAGASSDANVLHASPVPS